MGVVALSHPSAAMTIPPLAQAKRSGREEILSRYPFWRPNLSKFNGDVPKDVSSLATAQLSRRELEIVNLDATGILERIHSGKYTAVEVTTAFAKVAVAAQDLTNCLTEIFIDEALERAQALDDHFKSTGKIVGPLHGLPVSIKDHILLKGKDTSSGYTAWAGKNIADRDAVVVQVLRAAGAVFYVKTANAQTLLSLECDNNIFGRTTSPFNTTLSSGGSSGGEGALVGSRGSPLGIGTDIGGSIRVPAAFNGLYGLKASTHRIPHAGLCGSHDGMENILGVVGPLTRSARDLALFSKTMMDAQSWYLEHLVLEMPWKDDLARGVGLPEKLSIAILADDGVVLPHPPLRAALDHYRKALIAAGHEVIDWIPLDHQGSWDLIVKLYLLDGGEEYLETLAEGGEEPNPSFAWMMSHTNGRKPYTVRETFKLNGEREKFRAAVLQHWNATQQRTSTGRPVDAILTPTFASLAPPHDSTRWWGYSSYWNLADYPGAVFPTGHHLSLADKEKYPLSGDALPAARNPAEEYIRNQWSVETYEGAPVSLQLIGRRHQEEKVLGVLGKVEEAARAFGPFKG